ncbi:MAG TPA: glycosyltransferase [Thermoanaerobaculia bacterium]|nr:glycosyltransferase [Thermoanaerobaculia bacterium]
MRLLWLIDSFNVGGAESLAVTFARHVNRQDVDLYVACLATVAGNPLEKEFHAAGVKTINLGARNLRDRAAFQRLVQFVREHDIQLVHAHLTYAAIWSALLSRKTGVPSIASLHVAVSATKKVEASPLRRFAVEVRDRIMCFVLRRWSSRVVMVSGALRDEYLGRGLGNDRMRVVHNGIEVNRFTRDRHEAREKLVRELNVPRDATVLVTVNVLRAGKGVEVLLEAMRQIENAVLVVVGDGPMREEWSRRAEEQGIADRVRWAGFRRDVDTLLAGCDLFVHPSLDDAFPTVLLEASAAGLPVVASNLGGIPEIVVNTTGKLVPAGDPTALADAIRTTLADRVSMRSMSAAAQQRARELFSVEAWIARLRAVYAEALA